jgi:hypothetical protein
MTLKEKFRPHAKYWDCYNDEPLKYDHENKCEKIADDFAIDFAEWLIIIYNEDIIYDAYSKKELLEIYKRENEL